MNVILCYFNMCMTSQDIVHSPDFEEERVRVLDRMPSRLTPCEKMVLPSFRARPSTVTREQVSVTRNDPLSRSFKNDTA